MTSDPIDRGALPPLTAGWSHRAVFRVLRKKAKTGFMYRKSKRVHARLTWEWAWPRLCVSGSLCSSCVADSAMFHIPFFHFLFSSLQLFSRHTRSFGCVCTRVCGQSYSGSEDRPTRLGVATANSERDRCLVTCKPGLSLNI